MTAYDIAAGTSQAGLNTLVSELYAVPDVRSGLFEGKVKKTLPDIGEVTVTYNVETSPTFTLTPPTEEQWDKAQKKSGTTRPTTDAFGLTVEKLSGSAMIGTSPPLPAEGEVTVFGDVSVDAGVATLQALAVLIDESAFTNWDKVIVNDILIPQVLDMADKLLAGIQLPAIPEVEKLTFQPLALAVESGGIVVGTSLTGGTAPDVSGFSFPSGNDVFIVSKLTVVNEFFDKNVDGGPYTEEDSKGPKGWTAAGKVTADKVAITASISGSSLELSIGGDFDVYGELSGVGVGITKAALCPIGAAADAIADPGNWDKVISKFGLVYKPDPMPLPVTATAAAPATDGSQAISVSVPSNELPSGIQIVVKPEWSGSVTGSALATAAAAFADLISVIFGKLIIEKIVKDHGEKTFTLPKMSKTVELPESTSATVTLTAKTGAALSPHGSDELLQDIEITIA